MKFAAYLLAGIGLGLGLAYWQLSGTTGGDFDSGFAFEDGAAGALEQRIAELETALTLERYERQALADDLAEIMAAISPDEPFPVVPAEERAERMAAFLEGNDSGSPVAERVRERFEGRFDEASRDQRQINRFVEAGFTPERAERLLERQDELAMEALNARYEATQNGASAEEIASLNPNQMMREELGDADYERYLEGLGRPTSVNVREVLTNSPAQAAGLEAGDQIVAYNGQRIFEMNELTNLTYEGRQGEAVPIEVIRDGQRLQLYVERGPIGVSGGGRSTRRR